MDPVVLVVRAFLIAFTAVFLGVAGHVTADGLLPGPVVLGLIALFAVLPCLAMLRAPAGPVRIVALLVGGQAAIHLVLSVCGGHVGDVWTSTAGAVARVTASLPIGHLVTDLSAHAPMMLVHLLAALGVGLWLALGERCLWTLLTLLATAVRHLVTPAVVLAGSCVPRRLRAPRTDLVRVARPPHLLLARSLVRRGPPVLLPA